jgi:hypothetical protein
VRGQEAAFVRQQFAGLHFIMKKSIKYAGLQKRRSAAAHNFGRLSLRMVVVYPDEHLSFEPLRPILLFTD